MVDEPLPADREAVLSDPADADRSYWRATRRIIALTRDHDQFPLVFAENVNYGQRRNLLGLRTVGIAVAITTVITSALIYGLASGSGSSRAAHTYTVTAPDPFVAPYHAFLLGRTPKPQDAGPRAWRKDEYPA